MLLDAARQVAGTRAVAIRHAHEHVLQELGRRRLHDLVACDELGIGVGCRLAQHEAHGRECQQADVVAHDDLQTLARRVAIVAVVAGRLEGTALLLLDHVLLLVERQNVLADGLGGGVLDEAVVRLDDGLEDAQNVEYAPRIVRRAVHIPRARGRRIEQHQQQRVEDALDLGDAGRQPSAARQSHDRLLVAQRVEHQQQVVREHALGRHLVHEAPQQREAIAALDAVLNVLMQQLLGDGVLDNVLARRMERQQDLGRSVVQARQRAVQQVPQDLDHQLWVSVFDQPCQKSERASQRERENEWYNVRTWFPARCTCARHRRYRHWVGEGLATRR